MKKSFAYLSIAVKSAGKTPASPAKACLLALVVIILSAAGSQAVQPPDVLLITIDTLRADHVGAYGYDKNTTPAIDELAKQGLLFRKAFSPAPITLPSHASILTGVYPATHGMRDNAYFKPGNIVLISELLKKHKYSTAAFVSAAPLLSIYGLNRGFDVYNDAGELPERKADQTIEHALNWIQTAQKPYFLWVHVFDPHAPYQPPSPYDSSFVKNKYDGEIAFADAQIKRLLEAAGPNSIKIVTADHGESLGEHGESTHGVFLYNSTLSVPLILAAPGIQPAQRNDPVSLCDIAPTIAELTGVEETKQFECRSLLNTSQNRIIFSESLYAARNFGYAPLFSAINEQYKFILAPRSELYDWKNDPVERNDLSAKVKKADLATAVESYRTKETPVSTNEVEISANQREALASLGYTSGSMKGGTVDPKSRIKIIEDFNRGLNLLHEKNFKDAEFEFKRILQQDPKSPFAHRYLANTLAAQKRYAEAIESYKIASSALNDPEISVQMAKTYSRLNRHQEAESLLAKAVQNYPGYAEAKYELASIYMMRKNHELALKTLAEVQGEPSELYNQRGLVYLATGRLVEAEADFKTAAARGGKAIYFNNLGIALTNLKKLAEAEDALNKALQVDPTYTEAEANLGFALLQQSRWKDAALHLSSVADKKPEMYRARFALGIALENAGQSDKALEVYKKLKKEAPVDWPQHRQLQSRIQQLSEQNP